MTGHGFLLALQQFVTRKTERREIMSLSQRGILWEFTEFCMALDAVEEHVVGDCHCDDAAKLTEAARHQEDA